ncbi:MULTISPECIES: GNAT family N-acetyltransferase [Glutamicibacter]|uniref:N-acetyltransferase n=2 Tax=Glutamicibacter arilaitensis TaxID=256701 RepID=A0A2N7S520_9MICC|nr:MULTISPECIES: N-acetyltransferase [Glutamicibacter]PMQ21239.1 N-acetyltransferase [Glutamicibacter arilaitensis]CBT75558.1 putative GNAT-family acetyltransferase [Glutamicibacter arilaitensis Re117]HCH48552.1 N-acetyltransferase [Glutamicibacter sp.]HCJ55630.1 N-acetyltransferase [Glutamicibacter sp.]
MRIRPEVFDDRAAVYALTHAAFAGIDPMVEPEEVGLLQNLFNCEQYDSRFSIVALDDTAVIGHVIATWGEVEGEALLGLGPLAVAPEYQHRGVGSILMQEIHDKAEEERVSGIVLLGAPAYYRRFGYGPAQAQGIIPTQSMWGEHFMVRVFDEARLPRGTFHYAKPFRSDR